MQGPRAADWFDEIYRRKSRARFAMGSSQIEIGGVPLFIARTGYTGEDGFEVFGPRRMRWP